MPILLVSGFGNGCVLCGNLFKIMVRAVKLAVLFAANLTDGLCCAGCLSAGMSVIDCHGHRGFIACLVGGNDGLCALCRIQCKLIVCIECNRCAVHFYTFNIFFCNGNRLCFTVGLAVFQSFDNRSSRIKHNTRSVDVCYISAFIGKLCVNYILIVGVNAKQIVVCGKVG